MRQRGDDGGTTLRGRAPRIVRARALPLSEAASVVRARALEQMLRVVLEFTTQVGASPAETRRALRGATRRAKRASDRTSASSRYLQWQAYADLVRAWFSETPYLDESGRPRALALDDLREFAGLARRFVPSDSPRAAADALVALGTAVRLPDGRVRPVRRALLMPASSAASLERVPVLLRGVLSTIAHNVNSRGRTSRGRVERTAITVRLPRHLVPEFDAYMGKLAHVFIEQADAWMMKREGRDSSRDLIRAGVSVFAYVDPFQPVAATAKGRRRRPRSRV